MKGVKNQFIVFDLETGGLDYTKNPILEIAMIPVLKSKGVYSIREDLGFSCFIKNRFNLEITQGALDANKIKLEQVENGKSHKYVFEQIENVLSKLEKDKIKPILVGHNIDNFDIDFLKKLFIDNKKNMYEYFNKTTFDTLTFSRIIFENNEMLENNKLETVTKFCGIKSNTYHRAFEDTKVNAQLFIKMLNLIESRNREIKNF
jgi:DNA polymerase III alpha subunit (gram-positive type)